MNSQRLVMAVSLFLLALTVLIYLSSESSPMGPGANGQPVQAADVRLPADTSGSSMMLSEYRGRVVVLDFWASWCGPCKMSIPELQSVYVKYRPQNVQVIGMCMDEPATRKNVAPTIKSLGMTYPIVYGDTIPDLGSKYAINGLPSLYVIDKKGMIRYQVSGYDPKYDLDGLIAKLLKE